MRTLCAGFVWTTITARLSLLDKNIGPLGFTHIIAEKSRTKNVMYFRDRGCIRTLRHLYDCATARVYINVHTLAGPISMK